jgi:hypothetical protein
VHQLKVRTSPRLATMLIIVREILYRRVSKTLDALRCVCVSGMRLTHVENCSVDLV